MALRDGLHGRFILRGNRASGSRSFAVFHVRIDIEPCAGERRLGVSILKGYRIDWSVILVYINRVHLWPHNKRAKRSRTRT